MSNNGQCQTAQRRWRAERLGYRWLLALIAAASLVACNGNATPAARETSTATAPAAAGQIRVVVSLPVFVSLAEAVGGDRVQVSSIVPAGTDPHTYQPTPRDAQALADAKVIFVNGLGLEEWLSDLIASASSGAPVVELAEGLETAQDEHAHEHPEGTPTTEQSHEHAHGTPEADHGHGTPEGEHGHEHEGGNPHLWLDPDYAVEYVRRIAQSLEEIDPDGAATYRANAERYIAEIQEFDAWAKGQVEQIPPERRKLVTFHDAFPYFAEHYGLEMAGVIVLSPGREPSPQELAQLVDLIQRHGVPAIFTEPQFNPKLAETLAREAGVEVLELYSDTPPASEDYIGMMRRNIEHIVEGLG
ncbi:metal ABC transporter substrate-binding protein [Thermomicrobiaceae bacterium CFH 74404]|uniref:Metal ABC transporter substrate-binding protein n=1 Tax=Thermalbibacter longus TaxID=2951981 RepID=A0AA41WHR6_9BACT|nr:metal ABC transporter substrate-binding protein [Thermalbibacter longus]MCM8749616.1 metal ABC transporter substrate-binding protein [Thermalbibacter longus]